MKAFQTKFEKMALRQIPVQSYFKDIEENQVAIAMVNPGALVSKLLFSVVQKDELDGISCPRSRVYTKKSEYWNRFNKDVPNSGIPQILPQPTDNGSTLKISPRLYVGCGALSSRLIPEVAAQRIPEVMLWIIESSVAVLIFICLEMEDRCLSDSTRHFSGGYHDH